MDNIKCILCGEKWGMHYGPWCNRWHSGDLYSPEGVSLTELCVNCGEQFKDHHKRKFCKNGSTFARYTASELKLPEELFEI